jgi:hydrogenase nickel incorporation protein HypB
VCTTCGCGEDAGPRYTNLTAAEHEPEHGHDHQHPHEHEQPAASRTVVLEQRVLGRNDELAARNRRELAERGVVAVNLMSSPGAGKTTLLERTISDLAGRLPLTVLEGDQETAVDARRIRATGAPVVQVNTGAGCHLDAEMLRRGVIELDPPRDSVLFVENVGNLVCPALFDLGESCRVVVMSVPEGDDKPVKYPHMFRTADLVLINKVDLLPYVSFDVDRCAEQVRALNPGADVLPVSATRGDGLAEWYRWLDDHASVAVDKSGRPGVRSVTVPAERS